MEVKIPGCIEVESQVVGGLEKSYGMSAQVNDR